MSFQAYWTTSMPRPARPLSSSKRLRQAGVYRPDMKASELVAWLKRNTILATAIPWRFGRVQRQGWVEALKGRVAFGIPGQPRRLTRELSGGAVVGRPRAHQQFNAQPARGQ